MFRRDRPRLVRVGGQNGLGRKGHILRMITAANPVVGGVDGSRHHAHKQLADTCFGNGLILQFEVAGGTKLRKVDRFQSGSPP